MAEADQERLLSQRNVEIQGLSTHHVTLCWSKETIKIGRKQERCWINKKKELESWIKIDTHPDRDKLVHKS